VGSFSPVSLPTLQQAIDRIPRIRLATLPTPLHELKRFSSFLGGPQIYMKRDDLTGLGLGGNKSRMFEFLLAQVLASNADVIIAGAAVQSNYCRQLVAACNVLGLDVELVLRRVRGTEDSAVQGNLLLDLLAGASIHIIEGNQESQRAYMYELSESLRARGREPFVVRMANDQLLYPDVISYTNAFIELMEQCAAMDLEPTHLYVASYDTTQAGLELGKSATGAAIRIVGVAPADWLKGANALIARCANEAAEVLELTCRIEPEEIVNTEAYVGKGYGFPTREGREMLNAVARYEGIFLDPVYTSKAMAALSDHIRAGILPKESRVLFLHTGGAPALFAYSEELVTHEMRKRLHFVSPSTRKTKTGR